MTAAERRRNQIIYDVYQHNRNPFVDNRYYADMVFLNETAQQAWAGFVFSTAEQASASISGDLADPDGDGIPNLLEYSLNLNPKSAEAAAEIQKLGFNPGTLTLTHRKNRWASDVAYHYDISTDLVTWTEVASPTLSSVHLDGETDLVTFSTAVAGSHSFARLRITKVAAPTLTKRKARWLSK